MRPRRMRQLLLAGIATAVLTGSAVGWGISKAVADPAVPGMNTNCTSGLLGTMWCDGPVKPDGSWTRCFATEPQWTYQGFFVPQVQRCFDVPHGVQPALPLGQPTGHIGDGL